MDATERELGLETTSDALTVGAAELGACRWCSRNGHLVYHATLLDCPHLQGELALFAEFTAWDVLSDEALVLVEQEN